MKLAWEPLFTLLYCCFTQNLLLLYSTLRTFFCVTKGARACPQTSAASRHFCFAFSFTFLLYSALLSFFREPAPGLLCARTPLGLLYSTLLYSTLLYTLLYYRLESLPPDLCSLTPLLRRLVSVLLGFTRLYSVLLGFTRLYSASTFVSVNL